MRKICERTLSTISHCINPLDKYLLNTYHTPDTELSQWGYDRGHSANSSTSSSPETYCPGNGLHEMITLLDDGLHYATRY